MKCMSVASFRVTVTVTVSVSIVLFDKIQLTFNSKDL